MESHGVGDDVRRNLRKCFVHWLRRIRHPPGCGGSVGTRTSLPAVHDDVLVEGDLVGRHDRPFLFIDLLRPAAGASAMVNLIATDGVVSSLASSSATNLVRIILVNLPSESLPLLFVLEQRTNN